MVYYSGGVDRQLGWVSLIALLSHSSLLEPSWPLDAFGGKLITPNPRGGGSCGYFHDLTVHTGVGVSDQFGACWM